MRHVPRRSSLLAVALALAGPVPAQTAAPPRPADSFADALRGGALLVDARLRYEHVDDDAFAADADALTLRTRLGFRTLPWHGVTALVEAEDVRAPVEDYNSTANGRTGFPTVADPEGSEIDQAWIGWANASTQVTAGRQRVVLDNQRFFGNVAFRQNEQTFDALSAAYTIGGKVALRYAWLDSAQRIFGNEHPDPLAREQALDAHLVNAAWTAPWGVLTGYGYFVENEDVPLASTRTLGVRWVGSRALGDGKLGCALEAAAQDDYERGDARVEHGYRLAELAWSRGVHAVRLGHEVLQGDGVTAFQTPFAALHAFNGWADKFLVTPRFGLRDTYVEYGVKLGPGQFVVRRHRFEADAGGAHYGDEWDTAYTWPLGRGLAVQAKLARYDADAHARDTTKAWLSVEYRR
jgi:hypothetical protein